MKRSTAAQRVTAPVQICWKEPDAQRLLPGYKTARCASVPQCALSERADGSGERGSRCPRVCNAAPRSADWCRKLIEGGAEERVAALRDGRGVQRATVAGEPRPAVQHGRRVERGDGIPVGHRDCCPPGLSLPA